MGQMIRFRTISEIETSGNVNELKNNRQIPIKKLFNYENTSTKPLK